MTQVRRSTDEVTAPVRALDVRPESVAQSARYQAVLNQSASGLLAVSDRMARHHIPPVHDRESELKGTVVADTCERRGARSVGRKIRGFARLAALICRWTYERVALATIGTLIGVVLTGAASLARAAPPEATAYQITVNHAGVTASGSTLALTAAQPQRHCAG
jgi:hypothetical protein